nr:hypothetical protein CFP56_29131 [Quercus suber]
MRHIVSFKLEEKTNLSSTPRTVSWHACPQMTRMLWLKSLMVMSYKHLKLHGILTQRIVSWHACPQVQCPFSIVLSSKTLRIFSLCVIVHTSTISSMGMWQMHQGVRALKHAKNCIV